MSLNVGGSFLQVKLVKCIVQNIVVDISFNQLGGLCTLCFLEKVVSSDDHRPFEILCHVFSSFPLIILESRIMLFIFFLWVITLFEVSRLLRLDIM